jgi:hypothetical protein
MVELICVLTAVKGRAVTGDELLRDTPVVVQVRPTGGELHDHTPGRFPYDGGHFDQPGAPRAWLPFAERVVVAAAVVPRATAAAGKRLGRQGFASGWRRRIDDDRSHLDQQVIGRNVQEKAEEVGEVAMIAEPIGFQPVFEFLVAVFAFAPVGVLVVGRFREDERPGPVADHRPAIRPLGIGLALDDHPALGGPRLGANRESLGWLARSAPSIERLQISLKTGSLRSTSWSFWSG